MLFACHHVVLFTVGLQLASDCLVQCNFQNLSLEQRQNIMGAGRSLGLPKFQIMFKKWYKNVAHFENVGKIVNLTNFKNLNDQFASFIKTFSSVLAERLFLYSFWLMWPGRHEYENRSLNEKELMWTTTKTYILIHVSGPNRLAHKARHCRICCWLMLFNIS